MEKLKKLKLNKARLAFDMLEKEMSVITKTDELKSYVGGIQPNSYVAVSWDSGKDSYGNYVYREIGYVLADDGGRIEVYKNLGSNGSYVGYDQNCHGTTFSSGEYWINNYEVCDLLAGDDFSQVGDSSGAFAGSSGFQIGDVVVYYGGDPRDTSGNPTHSVKIIGFNPDGSPIVEGLGGFDTETSTGTIDGSWSNYSSYEIYRK